MEILNRLLCLLTDVSWAAVVAHDYKLLLELLPLEGSLKQNCRYM